MWNPSLKKNNVLWLHIHWLVCNFNAEWKSISNKQKILSYLIHSFQTSYGLWSTAISKGKTPERKSRDKARVESGSSTARADTPLGQDAKASSTKTQRCRSHSLATCSSSLGSDPVWLVLAREITSSSSLGTQNKNNIEILL